jgi:hypothetical protein
MYLNSFHKIFHFGDKAIQNIFSSEVEITEKIDGSQFNFGVVDNELKIRSKSADINVSNPEQMFKEAVNYVVELYSNGLLPNNVVFHSEYLKKPKHSTLCYERIPSNHLILFGVEYEKGCISDYYDLTMFAKLLKIEVVPLLFCGLVDSVEDLKKLLDKDSVLGGVKIEGFVVKNYSLDVMIGQDRYYPIMCGKYVSEGFKEVHKTKWREDNTPSGHFQTYCETFKTEARWMKAIFRLRDENRLTNSPKDIEFIIKEIRKDIIEEEKENIKDFLYKEFSNDLLRVATHGFPYFYKEHLLKQSFGG